MLKCLACKKEFEEKEFEDNDNECPHCCSKEVLELNKYNYFETLRNTIVLYLGNEHTEPAYAMFTGFNKHGWFKFDIINTTTTCFGSEKSLLEINEENLKLFKIKSLEQKINFHKNAVKNFEEQLNSFLKEQK